MKSYVCSEGTNQHSHSTQAILSYQSNDVIWASGTRFTIGQWKSYLPSAMKIPALVALEGTKDVWAAWIRVQGPQANRVTAAQQEAEALATEWLSYDPASLESWYDTPANRDSTYVADDAAQKQCLGGSDLPTVLAKAQSDQYKCLYSLRPYLGYSDITELDQSLHLWLNWIWKSTTAWGTPPVGWSLANIKPVPSPPAFGYLQNAATGSDLTVARSRYILGSPANMIIAGPDSSTCLIRTAGSPTLFLQPDANGLVVNGAYTLNAAFTFAKVGANSHLFTLQHNKSGAYLWVDGSGNVLLDGKGKADSPSAQWTLIQTLNSLNN